VTRPLLSPILRDWRLYEKAKEGPEGNRNTKELTYSPQTTTDRQTNREIDCLRHPSAYQSIMSRLTELKELDWMLALFVPFWGGGKNSVPLCTCRCLMGWQKIAEERKGCRPGVWTVRTAGSKPWLENGSELNRSNARGKKEEKTSRYGSSLFQRTFKFTHSLPHTPTGTPTFLSVTSDGVERKGERKGVEKGIWGGVARCDRRRRDAQKMTEGDATWVCIGGG